MWFLRPGHAALIVAALGLAVTCCTSLEDAAGRKSESSVKITDQTRWDVGGAVPAEASRLALVVTEEPGTDLAEYVNSTLQRELTARGFTISADSLYALNIQCTEPLSGTRGIPVTSRYTKVALEVSFARSGDDGPILQGHIDGILEESAVSPISGRRQARRRLETAAQSAVGKVARYLAVMIRDGGRVEELHASPPPPAAELVVPGQGAQLTAAVLDFDVGEGLDASVGQVLADLCRDVIGKTGRFILLDRNNMKAVLGEQDFAAAVRCTDTSCLVEYGRVLQAQKIVHGRASRIGQKFVLYMSLSDVNTAAVDATEVSPRADSIESLADSLPAQAARLVQGF